MIMKHASGCVGQATAIGMGRSFGTEVNDRSRSIINRDSTTGASRRRARRLTLGGQIERRRRRRLLVAVDGAPAASLPAPTAHVVQFGVGVVHVVVDHVVQVVVQVVVQIVVQVVVRAAAQDLGADVAHGRLRTCAPRFSIGQT